MKRVNRTFETKEMVFDTQVRNGFNCPSFRYLSDKVSVIDLFHCFNVTVIYVLAIKKIYDISNKIDFKTIA